MTFEYPTTTPSRFRCRVHDEIPVNWRGQVARSASTPGGKPSRPTGVTPTTPNGLLVQVTAASTDGAGRPVVSTQPATLQQAVGDADIARPRRWARPTSPPPRPARPPRPKPPGTPAP